MGGCLVLMAEGREVGVSAVGAPTTSGNEDGRA